MKPFSRTSSSPKFRKQKLGSWCLLALVVLSLGGWLVSQIILPRVDILSQLHDGRLESADYWREEPMILSAGLGFDNIIGVSDVSEQAARDAGGAWYSGLNCTNGETSDDGARTSVVPASSIPTIARGYADYDDGLPIVFSWPVATETVNETDFLFTLNNGETVVPNAVTMTPNWELNERNTVVAFGPFGNRGRDGDAEMIFPVKLAIVADDSPLILVGPGGQEQSVVGLTWESDRSPYDVGPVLVGAKLNAIEDHASGEGGVPLLMRGMGAFPNDEFSLYQEGDYRLRVLTSGGFSPDGITGLRPGMYEKFFRVHANGVDGETVVLEDVGVEYDTLGGTLRIVGLSDLGRVADAEAGIFYDDCYSEDRDNYIDIILVGDEAAAREVTFVEIPGLEGGYNAFFNPGGPGPTPFDGVRYTAPGPADLEPVVIALDDPMRVDRDAAN